MNILITGANGFVGRALTEKLLKTDNNIFLVSRDGKYKVEKAKVFYGDLEDKNFCEKIVNGIDIVYYLAGFKKNLAVHTERSFDVLDKNVLPFLNFLEAVKNSNIKKIIYLSSTNAEYAFSDSIDGYSIGKYINELIAKTFVNQTKIDIKVVRSVGVYGPGDNFDPKTANFIPSTIMKVYNSNDEISVWGSGKREIQFIYVDDLVSNLLKISDSNKNLFFIGNPKTLTINEIVEKIIKISEKNIKIKNDISKVDKPSQLFDFTNLIKPKFSIDQGLLETIKYYKKIYA